MGNDTDITLTLTEEEADVIRTALYCADNELYKSDSQGANQLREHMDTILTKIGS